MSVCQFENYFDEYIHGELDQEKDILFQTHLAECESCPGRLDEYYQVYVNLRQRQRPEIDKDLHRSYHKELKTRLLIKKPFGRIYLQLGKLLYSRSPWVRTAEVAALVLIGVAIGVYFFANDRPQKYISDITQNSFIHPVSRVQLDYMNYYFSASEMILLELINGDPNEADAFLTTEIAQKLLVKTFMVHEMALGLNNARMLRFLSQMELILIEIANAHPEETPEMIRAIRISILDAGLLEDVRDLLKMMKKSGIIGNLPG